MTTAPAARPGTPSITWLLVCSLWLVPVFAGFGMTTWLGFALIGVLVVRIRWVLLAGAMLWALALLEVGPESLALFLERMSYGYFDPDHDVPLLLLYLAGVAYGVHANRMWLRILWGRRERGQRMLGWVPEPAAAPQRHARASDVSESRSSTRAELDARAAAAFRALLAREEERVARLVRAERERQQAEAAATPVEPPTPAALTPPTTALPTTSLAGLPRGPVRVATATAEELAAIPELGAARAALLVAARGVRPLDSIDDVVELLDLDALEVLRARPYLDFTR